MTQYNTLNVKLYNSKRNKLKSSIKGGTEVTLNVSSNLIGKSNYETNLLTNTQFLKSVKILQMVHQLI